MLLPVYLTTIGLSSLRIGAVVMATLVGSAALTLFAGLIAYRLKRRLLLFGATMLMIAPGIGFAIVHAFWLANRIGLVNTMVFTHLPSNLFLILVPFMPNLPLAIALLLARSALSQMDVPTRNSYVMAVVTPAERPAASVTSVPRSLATAASPLLSGYFLSLTVFGWPLVIGGALKGMYDALLLIMFKTVRPPEETWKRSETGQVCAKRRTIRRATVTAIIASLVAHNRVYSFARRRLCPNQLHLPSERPSPSPRGFGAGRTIATALPRYCSIHSLPAPGEPRSAQRYAMRGNGAAMPSRTSGTAARGAKWQPALSDGPTIQVLPDTTLELTDERWARIAPLLPPQTPRIGRPLNDHRAILAGMLWVI